MDIYRVEVPFDPSTVVFKIFVVVLLSLFMSGTSYSFLRFRIKKKEEEYRNLIHVLGVSDDEVEFSTRAISQEYAAGDYILPVAFATLVCLVGFCTLMFGADLVSINVGKANIILTGMFANDEADMQRLRWQSQLVLAMAFAGAFIWSAQNIIRRLITGDLAPSTYYSAGLRMIFASLLSLMLSFFLEAFAAADYTKEILPVIAFLTGMLPENALIYLRERISIFSQYDREKSHDLPLEMIEGINIFHKLRLGEVGIDNAQNLAESNLVELLLKTPFNPNQVIDWIAQAKLYVYFKEDIKSLRKVGVRTVFDLRSLCHSDEMIAELCKEIGVSRMAVELVCTRLREDKGVARLYGFYELLTTSDMTRPENKAGVSSDLA